MTTVTSRRAKPDKKILAERNKLCGELLALNKKLDADFVLMKAIETRLKAIATEGADSFQVDLAGLGSVSVAPAHDAEFKGNVPQVQTEVWLALKPAERKALEKTGVIKIEAQWGKKSHGRVTVKLL